MHTSVTSSAKPTKTSILREIITRLKFAEKLSAHCTSALLLIPLSQFFFPKSYPKHFSMLEMSASSDFSILLCMMLWPWPFATGIYAQPSGRLNASPSMISLPIHLLPHDWITWQEGRPPKEPQATVHHLQPALHRAGDMKWIPGGQQPQCRSLQCSFALGCSLIQHREGCTDLPVCWVTTCSSCSHQELWLRQDVPPRTAQGSGNTSESLL